MTIYEACKRALQELKRPARAIEVADYIIKHKYFDFEITHNPPLRVNRALNEGHIEGLEIRVNNELNVTLYSLKDAKRNKSKSHHNAQEDAAWIPTQVDSSEEEFNEEEDEVAFLNAKDIKVDLKQMSVFELIRKYQQGKIEIAPDYQRGADLWDDKKKSRLIESILLKLPLPALYLNELEEGCYEVIDGLQRISAFRHFMSPDNNSKSISHLRLKGLEYLRELEGRTYKELPPLFQTRLEDFTLNLYVISENSPMRVKYNLFKRINTGGLPLNKQEIRNALNTGKPRDFIEELANLQEFKEATNYSISEMRMLHFDYVNRFLAFYEKGDSYKPSLDGFMTDAMRDIKEFSEEKKASIKTNFIQALNAIYEIFGVRAFRIAKKEQQNKTRLPPLNKALFEVLTVSFAKRSQEERDKLVKNGQLFEELLLKRIQEDEELEQSLTRSSGGRTQAQKRYKEINDLMETVLNNDN